MKKLYLIVFLMFAVLASYAQSPVVSFACHDENNIPQFLDSVKIWNWTRSWAVTIYYPNLSISLGDVANGIIEMEFDEEGLAQNIPNPFDGRTRAQLSLSGNEHIVMRVYDITGKSVAYYDGQLEAGKHDFDIVLSSPQTYILQVATSKKTYAIKMINTGRGGEDKISLHAFNNEVVLKSAKQIMDYDFEPGDCMHYQGFVTVNNAMVMTDPITQNQWNSELITFSLTSQQNTTVPVGIYAGVVGFNNQLYVKPIDLLNNSTQNTFRNFINNLPMGNGTILYHADYTALNNIANAPIPDELINVTLVTFTDGLDLGSWILNPLFTSETAYLNAVHNRILNDQLGGVNITAYSIGVRGSDLTDTARFRHDLRMLSSDPDHNVFEVANISEVNAQFREVAALLNQTSIVTTDISLLLPAPDPGTRVRFTFDNVTSATSSYYYIEGTYNYNNGVGTLSDIVYEGLTSTSGNMVTGTAQGIFDRFVFTDVKDFLLQQLNTNNIKQWYYIPSTQQWQYNSEFTLSNTTSSQQIHNSAVVMLVLDCSSSLGSSGFNTMKTSANNFLDILRNTNTLSAPTVQTQAATTVTDISAILNGRIINSGNLIVQECGFVLSLSPNMSNPIFYNTNNANSFNYTLTGLNPNTTYYYKAFARNNRGIGYGATESFTILNASSDDGQPCPGVATVTDIDNNTYNTVQIGNQCWMKENLRTTHYSNGTSIALYSSSSTNTYNTAYRYYPNNSSSNVSTYGYLYNWKAVMGNSSSSSANPSGVQGICPNGWHVPSKAEWWQLTDYVGSHTQYQCNNSSECIAKALASTTGWNSSTITCAVGNNLGTNNATSFSALPAGLYGSNSGNNGYNYFGYLAYFSSATEYMNNGYIDVRVLFNFEASMSGIYGHRDCGYSVRCVRDELPAVTTSAVSNIYTNTTTCGGNVTATGGTTVTARGVCWSTSQNPTVSDSHTTDSSGLGSFTSSITGLTSGTTYYVRAYATNSMGTGYGEQRSFTAQNNYGQTCFGIATVTDIDKNTYNTVKIGNQCWMKENIRTTHYANGESIAIGNSTSTTAAYRYYPNNNSSNVSTYGYLYNWAAVMHGASSSSANPSGRQGVCPDGWHVPSDAEWTQLENYVSGQSAYPCNSISTNISKALASTTGWSSNNEACAPGNIQANNNATGFGAQPEGRYTGSYSSFGHCSNFWSCTASSNAKARAPLIYYDRAVVQNYSYDMYYGFSVRCLRDTNGFVSLPTVTTSTISDITSISATCVSNVTSHGGAAVIARGVCWSTSQNSTVSDSHTTNGTGTGSFTSSITGLTAGTTYYVRAYAINSVGVAYGNEESFTTMNVSNDGQPCPGAATVTDIDNNTYNTVRIGNQCWMKENLRTTRYANGTTIPLGTSISTTMSYRYTPNNDASNVATYGYLYNWPAVMHGASSSTTTPSGVQGICPNGWHVPSDAEWTQLTNYVGSQTQYRCNSSSESIAKALASTTGWDSSTGMDNSACDVGVVLMMNNATGFSALPAGSYYSGYYDGFGRLANFWSATEGNDYGAYDRGLYYSDAFVYRDNGDKDNGFSVRCVRD